MLRQQQLALNSVQFRLVPAHPAVHGIESFGHDRETCVGLPSLTQALRHEAEKLCAVQYGAHGPRISQALTHTRYVLFSLFVFRPGPSADKSPMRHPRGKPVFGRELDRRFGLLPSRLRLTTKHMEAP